MSAKHPVVDFIEKLYNARELVAELYDSDDELVIDAKDKKAQRQLAQLHHLQLVVSANTQSHYLDSDFSHLIDKGLHQDTISYLNSDVGNEIQKIKHLFAQYQAASERQPPQAIKYKKALNKLFIRLTQRFNYTAEALFQRAQHDYGQPSYSQEKQQQNQYYQQELERLKASYYQVMALLEDNAFQAHYLIADMIITLKGRTMGFFDQVAQTLQLLKDYAYRAREQEIRTEKLRSLTQYLKANPTTQFLDTLAAAQKHSIFNLATPLIIKTYPNPQNTALTEHYLNILDKLKVKPKAHEHYQRQPAACATTSPFALHQQADKIDQLFYRVLAYLQQKPQPILARQALTQFNTQQHPINPNFWVYMLLNAFKTNRRIAGSYINKHYQYQIIYTPGFHYSGNVTITNLVLASRQISPQQLHAFIHTHPPHHLDPPKK